MNCASLIGLLGAALLCGCVAAPATHPSVVHGKFRLIVTGERDELDEPGATSAEAGIMATGAHATDMFQGHDRKDAKTSIAMGDPQPYAHIVSLRSSLMSDEDMLQMGITKAADSERTAPEQRNVRVKGLIYAIAKESDNDFHLIVGDPGCEDGGCFITVEVSGLPASSSPDAVALSAARSKFLAFFDGTQPGASRGYEKFDPAIPVVITGSLFFDVDHNAGAVGPRGFKPSSAWEIHPLTDITFQNAP